MWIQFWLEESEEQGQWQALLEDGKAEEALLILIYIEGMRTIRKSGKLHGLRVINSNF